MTGIGEYLLSGSGSLVCRNCLDVTISYQHLKSHKSGAHAQLLFWCWTCETGSVLTITNHGGDAPVLFHYDIDAAPAVDLDEL